MVKVSHGMFLFPTEGLTHNVFIAFDLHYNTKNIFIPMLTSEQSVDSKIDSYNFLDFFLLKLDTQSKQNIRYHTC